MKKTILILGFIIGIIFKIDAQIYETKYLIEYNDSTSLYDCKIVIIEGEATTYPQRIQFNAQYTIVVPTGTTFTLDSLHNPKENNQFYTGTIPCEWGLGPKAIAPPTQPELDYHTVIPNLSPPSAYNNLNEGDTITLFSIFADVDPCENAIRPFEVGVDPNSTEMPSGGDFSCGQTFGGSIQTYVGNLTSAYGNNYISPNDTLSVCIEDCITLEPKIFCLGDDLKYEWSTGDTTETIEVCPTVPTNYFLTVKHSYGNVLDVIPVYVDFTTVIVGPKNITACAGSTLTLSSCTDNAIWEQSSGNGFGLILTAATGGSVEATISSFASGTYDIICSVPGLSETLQITVNPAPLINIAASQICVGGTTEAASNIPGGLWVSTNLAIAGIDATTGVITGYDQGAATFTYTSSDGCTSTTNSLLVTYDIDALFTGPDEICIGTTSTVSPTTGGTWESANNTIAIITNGGVVTGVGPGVSYLVFIETGSGCRSNLIAVHVEAASIELTGPNGICVGETTTFSSETPGIWTSDDSSIATIANTGVVTGVSPGYARFTFFDPTTSCYSLPSEKIYVSVISSIEIEDLEICIGGTTQLSSDSEGTWVSDSPTVAVVNPNTGLVTAVEAGTASFTLTNDLGCSSSTYPLEITVFPNPEIEFIGPSVICKGESTSMSPNTGGAWISSNPIVASAFNNGNVTGFQSGTALLRFTDFETGCTSDALKITVIDDSFTPTAYNNGPVCVGEDISLATVFLEGASYEWTGPNGYISSDQNPIISNVSSEDQGNYCLVVSIDGCVSAEECTDVFVNFTPATPMIYNNSPICEGENIELYAETIIGATYQWTGPSGFFSYNQNPILSNANSSVAGTYCVIVTVDGCDSEASCSVVVIEPTPITPVANNNSPLCEGEDLLLTTDHVTNATYTWTGPGGYTSTDQNPTITNVTPSENGAYCVVVTVDGCESLDGCTDVVVNSSNYTPNVNNNGPLCEGYDLALTTDNVIGATYEWTGPSGFTSSDQNPIISDVSSSDAGTYSVTVIVDWCESVIGSTDVVINSKPATPTVSNNSPICEGEDLNLTSVFVVGAIYSWTGPGGYTSTDQNPTITNATPSDNGFYCVIVTVDGCESLDGCTEVGINFSNFIPTANNNGPLCEGDDLQLTTEYFAEATYRWFGPNGLIISDQQNLIVSNVSADDNAGTYFVGVLFDGCESQLGSTEVIIKLMPVTPTVNNNSPICEGEHVVLSATSVAGANYVWTGPGGFTSTNQNPVIIDASPSNSGAYCVIVTVDGCESEIGCTDVIINPSPSEPTVSNNGPICESEDLSLTTASIVGAIYSWTGPDGFSSNQQNPTISNASLSSSGQYCVIVTVNGCDSQEGCTEIDVRPTPNTPVSSNNSPICEDEDAELSTDAVSGATYVWTGPGGFTSTDQNPTITGASPSESGTYCVFVTVDGCESSEGCTDVLIQSTPVTPIANNNGPICDGEDLELTTNAVAGATYLWEGPTGIFFSEQNPVILNGASLIAGEYTLEITRDGCKSAKAITTVEIGTLDVDLTISNNTPVCTGEMVNLSVEEVEGATYEWTDPSGAFAFMGASVSFIAGDYPNGTFEVTVSKEECQKSNTAVVIYSQSENITIGNNILCTGESTTLLPISGGTYSLSNNDIGVINGGTFLALKSGTTDITFTSDLTGCESSPVTIYVANCIEAATSCEQIDPDDIICDYNDLANISGILSDQVSEGNQPPGYLCDNNDEAQNVSWFGFVALEGDYEIIINSESCDNNGQSAGLKIGVYSSCEFTEENVVFCETTFNSNIQTRISSTYFTPEQTYYLYIDGYEGSICDYSIDVEGFYDNTFCTDLSKVTGVAYIDDNENGLYEIGETLLRNALISLSPGNFSVLTNDEGKYIINTPKGGATLTAKMNEGHWIDDELTIADLTIFETCVEGIDFGFVPNLFYQEANVSVANTVTRCDWETRFYFTVENTGTIDLDAKFEFEFDSKASYFATNLIGLQVNGDVASGNLGAIKPFEIKEYWIKLKMPSGSTVLPMLDFKTTLYNSGGVEMDEYEQSEQLRCSYDPNDKREYPDREGEENLTLMDENIEYTIRFQNNGNDTAFLVKIIDQLDPNIEPTSIRVINSSHPVETCIENDNLIFLFENINLVDSMTNYDGSQGFVTFRCDTKEGRAENTIVNNTADIIFDTNVPIVTNSTINTLVSELCTHVTTEIDIEICDGDIYNGYEESGTYTEIFPLQYGCDSMVVIYLEVQGITYSSQEIQICEGEAFEVNGNEYTLYESQKIVDTLSNDQGCISNIFIFDVLVNPILNINIDITICEGLEYDGLTESGIYTIDSFDAITGCDIITTINLDVLPMSDPSCIVRTDDLTSSAIKIYPIPARDVLYLEGDVSINAVSIYTMDYQKLKEFTFKNIGNKQQISTADLSGGIYIIEVKSEDMIIYKKLIVE